MIVLISKDLFFVPTVQSAAQQCGLGCTVLLNYTSKKEVAEDTVRVCLQDLGDVSLGDLEEVASGLRQRFPNARLTGYASHVHEAKLAAAAKVGFEPVLSRGQISSILPKLLRQWV